MNTQPSDRRYDLDWLRVAVILVVFFYHSTRFFNLGDWHVKNPTTYWSVEMMQEFVEMWMMPLIFVISGASLFYALGKGGAGKFLKDKVLRLLVPLLVGAFTHAALQVYLDRTTHGLFSGTFFQFLPLYFRGVYEEGNPAAGNFAYHGMHLWYLLVLFLLSVIFYPLMRWLKGRGSRVLRLLAAPLALPGGIYLLALPIFLLLAGDVLADAEAGGWAFICYAAFLLSGFVLAGHEGVQERIRQQRWISLGLGLVTLAAYLILLTNVVNGKLVSAWELGEAPLAALGSWSWILAFMGFFRQYMYHNTPYLKDANEAVLPFYILHQTVLLVVGYYVVRWPLPDLLKWALIAGVSLALILGLYAGLVRRFNLLRFLFGMKLQPRAAAEHRREVAPAGR